MPVAIGCALLAAGCATVFSKADYPVRINSTPPGAEIVITASDGTRVFEGTTPTTVTLKTKKGFFSGQDYTIQASMRGYESLTAPVVRSIDGWYIANVLFGGVLGLLVVDPATGAMWKLKDEVALHLVEAGAPGMPALAPGELGIVTLAELPALEREALREIR
jgi:hypothetical protein